MSVLSHDMDYKKVAKNYLRILPREFNLIDSVKADLRWGLSIWSNMSNMTRRAKRTYLNNNERFVIASWLSLLDGQCESALSVIHFQIKSPKYFEDDRQAFSVYQKVQNGLAGVKSVEDYLLLTGTLRSLEAIGLDIRGGLHRLAEVMHYCQDQNLPFQTACLLVKDEQKAREYIDIGVHLLDPSFTAECQTLEQAAANLAQIEELTKMSRFVRMSPSNAGVILNDGLASGKLTHLVWESKGEMFRIKVFMKFREIMIKASLEYAPEKTRKHGQTKIEL